MSSMDTILLVEDDESDLMLMQTACDQAGLAKHMRIVRNGAEAVRYLKGDFIYADRSRFPFPGLLLLDLKMPGLNGFEVLRWLRSQPPLKLLIAVVLTASKAEQDIQTAYDLGANSYLIKPRTFQELVRLVTGLKTYWLELNVKPHCLADHD